MGELYEARGDREKAKEYYGRFVALWRDADSDLQPAVQEARARLAQLAAEPEALSQRAGSPLQVLNPRSVYIGQVPTSPVRIGMMPR